MKISSSAKSGVFTVRTHVLGVHQYVLSHLNKLINTNIRFKVDL